MTAKLSWKVEKTSLVLTVTDGPKTSHYKLAKTASVRALGETLRAVLADLGGPVPEAARKAVYVAPEPIPGMPPEGLGPVTTVGQDVLTAKEPIRLMAEPISEEESLMRLKQQAWEWAQKNVNFADGVIPDDTAARLVKAPAHEAFGVNPGLPVLDAGGVTAVDGSFISPEMFRPKPAYNVSNHED